MMIAVGADHAGWEAKCAIRELVREMGHDVEDVGTYDEESVDYPDYARRVADAVREGTADRGIIACGSGVGVSVAANKVPGIRAAVCHDTYSARQGVEHDDMNVLCVGARVIGRELVAEIVKAFVRADFSGEERHRRRLGKVDAIEREFMAGTAVDSDESGNP